MSGVAREELSDRPRHRSQSLPQDCSRRDPGTISTSGAEDQRGDRDRAARRLPEARLRRGSRLGWRIIVYCDPFEDADDALAQSFREEDELHDLLPAKYR